MTVSEQNDSRRQKFVYHFGHFGSSLRFPFPCAQFAGKPNHQHDLVKFDGRGFRNLGKRTYEPSDCTPRIFVVGDSTMVEGDTEDDTVSGCLEIALRQAGFQEAQVFNFGVVSTCFTQMSDWRGRTWPACSPTRSSSSAVERT